MNIFQQFVNQYELKTYEKGQIILLKDESPKGAYIIQSGLVKTYTITSGGTERLIAIHSKNEDLPIGYAFGIIEKSQFFYEAYSRCTLRIIPREAYLLHLHKNLESFHARHVQLQTMLLSSFERVNALEQSRAIDKIAYTLTYMVEKVGVRLRPHKTRWQLAMTQQEIADLLGLTRETTGIELKKLEMKNLISHSRKKYIFYAERMQKYLQGR
jgi:CRP/FNR family cyclic AMP-dependent transcriptional regulator